MHTFLAPVFHDTFVHNNPANFGAGAQGAEHGAGFWASYGLMVISGGLAIVGILAAYLVYVRERWVAPMVKASLPRGHKALWNKYYVDEVYQAGLVEPARTTGRVCVGLDDYLIDGLIWLVTVVPRAIAYALRGMQTGVIQSYGLSMVIGLAVIVVWAFWSA